MRKNECIAMVLAGGQGSRLGALTKKIAKPAVPFGGKYRIIDFTLSNCSNSCIDTVGVLTQYQPTVLNSHIGSGVTWDLNRKNGGVHILPPYLREDGGGWYKGTADAICQNIEFIEQHSPEHVIILSGDHIYKMDYRLMLNYHKQTKADATISVIEVPLEEASRFGIMNTNEDGRIKNFEEKPKNPKSTLASMGVYIFNWAVLKKFLKEDKQNTKSSHDFGKNIIPSMLESQLKMYAYRFKGYWVDVGTVESFWQANMDLLSESPKLDLYDSRWKIYTMNTAYPPNYIASTAKIQNSIIQEGCRVYGEVENSLLFPGVHIGANTTIKNSIIMSNVHIGSNARIEDSVVCEDSVISDECHVSTNDSNYYNNESIPYAPSITVIGGDITSMKSLQVENNGLPNIEPLVSELRTSNVS